MAERPRVGGLVRAPRAVVWLAALLCLCAMPPGLAHQLRVFAAADGDLIRGSVYFAGGNAARAVQLRIEAADGTLLATPVADAEGHFSWRAATPADHLVIARSADGHRAEWLVAGAELAPAFAGRRRLSAARNSAELTSAAAPAGERAGERAGEPGFKPAPDPVPGPVPRPALDSVLDPALAAAIESAVARQVRPLREELAEARARARMQDVIGGIGYIVGVAGLVLWWTARRRAPSGKQRSRSQKGIREP
jgi:nickel transport protein